MQCFVLEGGKVHFAAVCCEIQADQEIRSLNIEFKVMSLKCWMYTVRYSVCTEVNKLELLRHTCSGG